MPLAISVFGFSTITGIFGCAGYGLFLYYSLVNQNGGDEKKEEDKDLECKFIWKIL